jgi:hypothetical protein
MAQPGLESEDHDNLYGPDSDGEKEGRTQAAGAGRLKRQLGVGSAEAGVRGGGDQLGDEDAGKGGDSGGGSG